LCPCSRIEDQPVTPVIDADQGSTTYPRPVYEER